MENQGTNEDDSQSDPRPEARIFRSDTTQNSGPEVGHNLVTGVQGEGRYGHDMVTKVQGEIGYGHAMVTRVQGEIRHSHDMVTGVQGEIRYGHDMVTGVTEKVPFWSLGTSSGKQKKARSTTQPQFRSEDTPATIEADQILLALQQLATDREVGH